MIIRRVSITFAAAIFMLATVRARVDAADVTISADVPAPPAKQVGIWGAIAYSASDEKHGFTWGADKRAEAEAEALDHCRNDGGKACQVVETFRNHRHWNDDDGSRFPYNHCAALAVEVGGQDIQTAWGTASAETRNDAEEAALGQCREKGTDCRVREWACT